MALISNYFNTRALVFNAAPDTRFVFRVVSPQETLPSDTDAAPESSFLIGSLTKLFVGAVYAQLFEEIEDFSPDSAVNAFAKRFQLTKAPHDPIRVKQLLTHTSGIDYSELAIAAPQWDFARHLSAAPMFAASRRGVPTYSNFGAALAGHLLEDVLEQDIATILRQRIWARLGMDQTCLLGEEATACVAKTVRPPMSPFYVSAGGSISTADDMARFAQALLINHSGQDTPLFNSAQSVHYFKDLFGWPSGHGGLSCFLTRFSVNDIDVHCHTGSWPGFASVLCLIPTENIAFVALCEHGPSSNFAPQRTWSDLMMRCLAHTTGPPAIGKALSEPHDLVSGTYVSSKLPNHGPERMMKLLQAASTATFRTKPQGVLMSEDRELVSSGLNRLHASSPRAIGDLVISPGVSGPARTPTLFSSGDRSVMRCTNLSFAYQRAISMFGLCAVLSASVSVMLPAPTILFHILGLSLAVIAVANLVLRDQASLAESWLRGDRRHARNSIRLASAAGICLVLEVLSVFWVSDPWPGTIMPAIAQILPIACLIWFGLLPVPQTRSAKAASPI